MLAGLDLAKSAGAKKLNIKSDSALVVRQSVGEYEATNEVMKLY